MIKVPSGTQELIGFAGQLIEQCRVSVGMRSAYYRTLNAISETGRYDGTKSLINMMFWHLDRTASHLFSPVQLKFSVGFERIYPKFELDRAAVAARALTKTWERNGIDTTFGRGVFESLKYGAAILKQWPAEEGKSEKPVYYDKLVMPWQFGVYREDENRLDRQEALCETVTLTLPEVWQRIHDMPGAEKLFERIATHAKQGEASSEPTSFFHQVLSTSQLNTGVQGMTRPVPGGIVQLNNDPNYSIMGPVLAVPVVQMHELWVKDEVDYTTIQFIEPDIIIEPKHKRRNLLGLERQHPYTLIQPNEVTNWFWGRSELVDLIEPQALLSTWCDDARRLFGLQVDKILAFIGEAGMTDELYAQFRGAGFTNLGQGSDVKDLTPSMPPEMMQYLKFAMEIINTLGSFPEIMQGKGESGVRAGTHANTLLKTGSPTLRDRSLLVERQCAQAGDLTLSLMEAKDESFYWLKADDPIKDTEETKFLLAQMPDDWHVEVDSHSSSPIFMDENAQLILQSQHAGIVTPEYVLDNMPFPNRDIAKTQLREKETKAAAMQQKLLQQFPEVGHDLAKKQLTGSKR